MVRPHVSLCFSDRIAQTKRHLKKKTLGIDRNLNQNTSICIWYAISESNLPSFKTLSFKILKTQKTLEIWWISCHSAHSNTHRITTDKKWLVSKTFKTFHKRVIWSSLYSRYDQWNKWTRSMGCSASMERHVEINNNLVSLPLSTKEKYLVRSSWGLVKMNKTLVGKTIFLR